MLTNFLILNEDFATSTIGVGGFVLNDKNELLVVAEKFNPVDPSRRVFKLPGGYVNAGESIIDAAIREIKEECGIDTEFISVSAFRQ